MKRDSLESDHICKTCNSYLRKEKLSPQNITNGLELAEMPDFLRDMNELETVLVAKTILFMKIFALPVGAMPALIDKVVNGSLAMTPTFFLFSQILPFLFLILICSGL